MRERRLCFSRTGILSMLPKPEYRCFFMRWIWAVMHFLGREMPDVPVLWVIYAFTNGFLYVAFLVVIVNQFMKWDLV